MSATCLGLLDEFITLLKKEIEYGISWLSKVVATGKDRATSMEEVQAFLEFRREYVAIQSKTNQVFGQLLVATQCDVMTNH